METKNAKIASADLCIEDHGLLACGLRFEWGSVSQGTGLYAIDDVKGRHFIRRILETVGVSEWRKLNGMFCRVTFIDGQIKVIGNIVEDRWFDLREIEV